MTINLDVFSGPATGRVAQRLTWSAVSGGREECLVYPYGRAPSATGRFSGSERTPVELHYRVLLDVCWRTRRVEVTNLRSRARIELRSDGEGRWSDGFERPLPELAQALDVDLSFTPFSNTLPVRRLQLVIGQSADLVTAYLDAEQWRVFPDPQRYTRLDQRRYLYESLDSDFSREFTVDEDGFVVEYAGMFHKA